MKLTARQRDVAELVRRGKSNKQIADDLGITEGTVKEYLHTIFQRLKVHNRTQLAIQWTQEMETIQGGFA